MGGGARARAGGAGPRSGGGAGGSGRAVGVGYPSTPSVVPLPPRAFRASSGEPRSLEARSARRRRAAGEEHTIVNGQLRRVGPGRWGAAKEQALLAELAWSGSISRGCRAAGVSTQALSRRRLNDRHLDAACDAAVEIARKRLNGYVVEAANRTFDPDELPLGEGGPTVTIDQAIAILKLGAGRGAAPAAAPVYEPYEPADVMKRLEQKMRMLGPPQTRGEGAADRG